MAENYLIIGDDDYIREREIGKISGKLAPGGEGVFGRSVYLPSDLQTAIDSLRTMPLFAKKNLVIIKDIEEVTEEGRDRILNYLNTPSGDSVLVMTAAESFRKTSAFRKMEALIKTVDASVPSGSKIKEWIKAFFRKEGIPVSPQAVELIAELKGTDTAAVRNELEKIACYAGKDRVEVETVEKLIGRSVADAVFKLVDAINRKDARWAFNIVNDLYGQKKQPVEIIGYLGWYMRTIQSVKFLMKKGLAREAIASKLGLQPWRAGKFCQEARGFSVSDIAQWVNMLLETDRDIKTGAKNPSLAIDMLISSFAG